MPSPFIECFPIQHHLQVQIVTKKIYIFPFRERLSLQRKITGFPHLAPDMTCLKTEKDLIMPVYQGHVNFKLGRTKTCASVELSMVVMIR